LVKYVTAYLEAGFDIEHEVALGRLTVGRIVRAG
jgi:hypothetical protein